MLSVQHVPSVTEVKMVKILETRIIPIFHFKDNNFIYEYFNDILTDKLVCPQFLFKKSGHHIST